MLLTTGLSTSRAAGFVIAEFVISSRSQLGQGFESPQLYRERSVGISAIDGVPLLLEWLVRVNVSGESRDVLASRRIPTPYGAEVYGRIQDEIGGSYVGE